MTATTLSLTIIAASLYSTIGAAQEPRPAPAAPFPVTIRVDASQTKGELKPIWRFFGADEPNYAYMKDGRKLLARARRARAAAGLFPHAQPAQHRRRHARAEVGQHNVYTEDAHGQPGLRLDDRRSHLRHLSRSAA